MERRVLPTTQMSTEALSSISQNHKETIDEIITTISQNKIVVIGMGQNPVVKKARRALKVRKLDYTYLSYGNYISKWQLRLAIKLWSGWATFPQVFIDGKLVGGSDDLNKYLVNYK